MRRPVNMRKSLCAFCNVNGRRTPASRGWDPNVMRGSIPACEECCGKSLTRSVPLARTYAFRSFA